MANYVKPSPIDRAENPLVGSPPPFKALQTFQGTTPVSSVITLNDNSTQIEVGTQGSGAVIRWVPRTETAGVSPFGSVIASGASANFDHYIPPNTQRYFAIPREVPQISSIVGANIYEGLYNRVAVNMSAPAPVPSIYVATY